MLDLRQMSLDLAGELRRSQSVDVNPLEGVDQADALHGGAQSLAEPHRVALGDQVLDDVGPGGGSAESLLVEGRRQLLVLEPLARVLHQGEQPRLADAGGGLGLVGIGLDGAGPNLHATGGVLSLPQGRQGLVFSIGAVGEDASPAGLHQGAASRAEPLARDLGDALDALPEGGRMEGAEETPQHQIVESAVVAPQLPSRQKPGGDDREVVRDAGVVEDAIAVLEPGLQELAGEGRELGGRGVGAGGRVAVEHLIHRLPIVAGQAAGVGAGIGEQLVDLVAALGCSQRAAGGPAEASVGIALEGREVEERGRGFAGGLARLPGDTGATPDGSHDGLRALLVEDPVILALIVVIGLEVRVVPGPGVGAAVVVEARRDPPVGPGDVGEHAELPLHEQSEGGSLNAARGPGAPFLAALETLGEGPGGVHPDQPVRVGPALGGLAEWLELRTRQQLGETLANGSLRHGLEPEADDGLAVAQEADDLPEDQLALAPRVAGVDDPIHVLALEQLLDDANALALTLLLLDLEAIRDDRQHIESPPLELLVELLGLQQLEEVAHREAHQIGVALPVAFLLRESSEGPGDVAGDTGLLGDDE